MAENRFKLQFSRGGTGHPAVFHALALDEPAAKLVDLHAYHQLVSGDSLVKLYRFPVEERLLDTVTRQAGVNVPAPSAELLLYLLRIMLKHTRLAEAAKVNEKYAPIRDELLWLLERSDVAQAQAICRLWFPTVSVPLADMVAAALDPGQVLRRSVLGLRIARDLRHLTRLGPVAAQLSHFRQVGREVGKRLGTLLRVPVRQGSARSLMAGGAWIALTGSGGVDTRAVAKLMMKRLGRYLDVELVHVGRPPQAVASVLLAPVMAAASLLSRPSRRRHSGEERLGEGRGYALAYVLERLLLARDRKRMLTRMMRAVTSGSIVISQGSLAGLGGSAFDDRDVDRARSRLHRWLMSRERNLSRDFPTPRLVLALGAEAGTASQGSSVTVIDASGTVEDALRHCMRETWEAL
ncbi:MAG TPA: hypothetical protein VFT07_05650 [Sphingomicrobium sp.]|nr:hypothetical protein [Sphingomicrobium sp.]